MDLMRGVIDPELGSDIVELGMAKGATVSDDGVIQLEIALTTSGCPLRAQIQRDIRSRLTSLPGVTRVKINWGELTQDERADAMAKARFNVSQNAPDTSIPSTTKVVMVASGKGGVGKSSITTNLAAALARHGASVADSEVSLAGSPPQQLELERDPVHRVARHQREQLALLHHEGHRLGPVHRGVLDELQALPPLHVAREIAQRGVGVHD